MLTIAAVLKLKPVTTFIIEAVAIIWAPVAINKANIEVNAVKICEAFPYLLLIISGCNVGCEYCFNKKLWKHNNPDFFVYKEIIDLRELNKCNKNKKRYELSILNKRIVGLCKGYHVEYVCLEGLSIRSSDKGKGTKYNKLLNNDWNRNFVVNNLTKQLNINDIKLLMVNPFYTSFMGQLKNMATQR